MRPNLGLFLTKRAQLGGSREALVEIERGRRFSYAELEERSNRAANAFASLGVRAGDRVGLLLMNGVEYVESYFALAKLGATMVALNWRLVADELAFILTDSGATLLLADAEFDDLVGELRERDTPLRTFVRVANGTPVRDDAHDWDGLLAAADPSLPELGGEGPDELFIMYTSGTTGLPKGVIHTHDTFIAASTTVALTADMRLGDRFLQMLPMFHVGALSPVTSTIHRGGTIVMMRAFDPVAVLPAIAQERVTNGLAVPAMLKFILQASDPKQHDTSSLRWMMSGAAPVPVPLIERYAELGIEIHQVYGLTESGGPACLIGPEHAIAKAGSTGPAFFHTEVRVVDDQGADVLPGEIGEVIIRGKHVMKGYWNRPEATAETLRDGWLYSGDMATVDEDGFVYIQDRKKDMIITGGENVYPAEIEEVLTGHPDIADCAVIGTPSEKWGESPLAVVVPAAGAQLSEGDVLDWCNGKLARFKLPRVVAFTDEIPRNPTGKALKRLLREQFPGPAPD
jgi:O-succinylbenzoate-CoA ligase